MLILHGADSAKEGHFEFARAARSMGLEAIAFDLRGHGDSPGPLDEHVIEDLAAMASLLSARPLALRGSSMGGYLALIAARALGAAAVVAICPAPGELLLRGLRGEEFAFSRTRPGWRPSWPNTTSTRPQRSSISRCCSCTPRATS